MRGPGVAAAAALLLALAPSATLGQRAIHRPTAILRTHSATDSVRLALNRENADHRIEFALQAEHDALTARGFSTRPRLCLECAHGVARFTFELPGIAGPRDSSFEGRFRVLVPAGDTLALRASEAVSWAPDSTAGVFRIEDSLAWMARWADAARLVIVPDPGGLLSEAVAFELQGGIAPWTAAIRRCRHAPPVPAPDAPPAGAVVAVEEFPSVIGRGRLAYPEAARARGVQGAVVIHALVGKDGTVREAFSRLSIPSLDEAALAHVRAYRFRPARSNGVPVAVWVAVPIRFQLDSSP